VQQQLLAFAVVAGLLTITPGLDTALVIRYSLLQGRWHAFLTALGICAGLLVWGVAASVGISALVTASQLAYDALRIVGALWMAWLGIRMLRQALSRTPYLPIAEVQAAPESAWASFRSGFLTNLLNPKIGAFYVAVLPQFIPAGVPSAVAGVALTLVHVVESVLWFALLILAAHTARRWLERAVVRRWIDGITGTVLLAFSARLALVR
jgi:threonine/homoserine/homoserine lactone efflux protein